MLNYAASLAYRATVHSTQGLRVRRAAEQETRSYQRFRRLRTQKRKDYLQTIGPELLASFQMRGKCFSSHSQCLTHGPGINASMP